MATQNLEYIDLDPGDQGIQWIEGVGFRPVDSTEDLPFFTMLDCEIIDSGDACAQGLCTGKLAGYEPPIIMTPYDPPAILPPKKWVQIPDTYAPAYTTPFYATPHDFWLSHTPLPSCCTPPPCCSVSEPQPEPSYPPTTTGSPEVVPLPPSLLMLLSAALILRKIANET